MKKEKLEAYAALTVTALGIGAALFLFFKYLFLAVLPFLISWAVAFAIRPAVKFISEKSRIPKKAVSVLLTILCVILSLGLVVLFVFFSVKEAWEFFSSLASDERVIDIIARITNPFGLILGGDDGGSEISEHIGNMIKDGIGGLVSRLVGILSHIVASVPRVVLFILVTVIASIYFALDIDRINAWVKKLLPERILNPLVTFKNGCLTVGVKYVRSYALLMGITFSVMLAGLLILRRENALIISIVIAILDLLPVIGVGSVIVPWSIVELLLGNTRVGIGLIVLLVIHELIRQFSEPRIIGKSIGVHPIISLLLLYVGCSVFGIAGILLGPLVAVALNGFLSDRLK